MKTVFSCLMFWLTLLASLHTGWTIEDIFEVKGTSTDSILYDAGAKIDKGRAGDEVVYLVNVPEKTVTRTAVYNKNVPDSQLGGLQSDNTVYNIFHDEPRKMVSGQRLIKAFGKAGAIEGYEIVVIGEAFVITARSTDVYFALYHYKRTDPLAERFREKDKER